MQSLLTEADKLAIHKAIDDWIASLVVKCGEMRKYRQQLEEEEYGSEQR